MHASRLSGAYGGQAPAESPAQYDDSFRQRSRVPADLDVNRYFYERMGDRGYARLLHGLGRAQDEREWLRGFYEPRLWKTLWFPVARIAVEAARRRAEIGPRVAPEPALR